MKPQRLRFFRKHHPGYSGCPIQPQFTMTSVAEGFATDPFIDGTVFHPDGNTSHLGWDLTGRVGTVPRASDLLHPYGAILSPDGKWLAHATAHIDLDISLAPGLKSNLWQEDAIIDRSVVNGTEREERLSNFENQGVNNTGGPLRFLAFPSLALIGELAAPHHKPYSFAISGSGDRVVTYCGELAELKVWSFTFGSSDVTFKLEAQSTDNQVCPSTTRSDFYQAGAYHGPYRGYLYQTELAFSSDGSTIFLMKTPPMPDYSLNADAWKLIALNASTLMQAAYLEAGGTSGGVESGRGISNVGLKLFRSGLTHGTRQSAEEPTPLP